MNFIITIDTEEDNWGRYSVSDNPVNNIERIVYLQKMFDRFDAKPTYLITYPVATNPKSIEILKRILDSGNCEIGMHCHPWNTPPFDENIVICEQDTMLCNLPEELVFKKLATLHEAICRNFGCTPVSFRAGRWGFGPAVANALCCLGYQVDTSVSPYIDWRFCHGPDYSEISPSLFRFDTEGVHYKKERGVLLEVPATVGFLQKNFSVSQKINKLLEGPLGRKLRLKGILDRLGVLNKVFLSPELADIQSLINLANRMELNNFPCINFTFHSTSLLAGLSPFVTEKKDEIIFFDKIRIFLELAHEVGWKSVTLNQMQECYEKTCV